MPYQEAPDPPITDALREACAEAMHVLLPDGTTVVGDRSVIYVYERVGYPVAALFRYPPLSWLSPWLYALVANHRRTASRFVFRP